MKKQKHIINLIIILSIPVILSGQNSLENQKSISLNDTIEIMLTNKPDLIMYKNNIDINKAKYKQAKSDYDVEIKTFTFSEMLYKKRKDEIYDVNKNKLTLGSEITKKTRSGVDISGGASYNILEGPAFDNDDNDIKNFKKTNNFQIYVNFKLPLLKSWKSQVNAYEEYSSKIEYRAKIFEVQDKIANDLKTLAIAYWEFAAAYERYNITKQTEERAKNLIAKIKVLIKNNERPAADLNLFLANLARVSSDSLKEEQNFIEKKHDLIEKMGYPVQSVDEIILVPAHSVPGVDNTQLEYKKILPKLTNKAITSSRKLLSYIEKMKAAKIKMIGSKNNLNDDLDLDINFSMSQYQMGYYQEDTSFNPDYSGKIILTYKLPVSKNRAKGKYLENYKQYQNLSIEADLLNKKIRSNIEIKLKRISNIIQRYKKNVQIVGLYKKTMNNELKKFSLGMSTSIEILNIEKDYLSSLIEKINNQLEYAITLTEVQYEMGNLFTGINESKINIEKFFKMSF